MFEFNIIKSLHFLKYPMHFIDFIFSSGVKYLEDTFGIKSIHHHRICGKLTIIKYANTIGQFGTWKIHLDHFIQLFKNTTICSFTVSRRDWERLIILKCVVRVKHIKYHSRFNDWSIISLWNKNYRLIHSCEST